MGLKDRFKRMNRKSDSSGDSESTATSEASTDGSLNKSTTNSSRSSNNHILSKGLPWRRRHAGSTATKSTASNDSTRTSKNNSSANLQNDAKKEEMRRYAAMFSSYSIKFGATNYSPSLCGISPCTSPRQSLDMAAAE